MMGLRGRKAVALSCSEGLVGRSRTLDSLQTHVLNQGNNGNTVRWNGALKLTLRFTTRGQVK